MSRLIDADDLLAKRPFAICGGDLSEYDEGYLDAIADAVEAVKHAPAKNRKACDRAERGKAQGTGTRTENLYMTHGRVASADIPSIRTIRTICTNSARIAVRKWKEAITHEV